MANRYDEVYTRSLTDPEGFWAGAEEEVHWFKKRNRVLGDSNKPFYRWFAGAEANTCYEPSGIGEEPSGITA